MRGPNGRLRRFACDLVHHGMSAVFLLKSLWAIVRVPVPQTQKLEQASRLRQARAKQVQPAALPRFIIDDRTSYAMILDSSLGKGLRGPGRLGPRSPDKLINNDASCLHLTGGSCFDDVFRAAAMPPADHKNSLGE